MTAIIAVAFLAAAITAPEAAAPGYPAARAGYVYSFPRDHGSHPDYRTEWWYFTGNVAVDDGRRFGFKLTFFRHRVAAPGAAGGDGGGGGEARSPLLAEQVHIAHFAVSDIAVKKLHSAERIGREGFAQARASTTTLDVANHGFRGALGADGVIRLVAGAGDFAIDLALAPVKPAVIHGRDGVHQKADQPDQTSHYLSFTRLEAAGTLTVNGAVHQVRGLAWMDHEWGSARLGMIENGWDWFGLQLDGGEELMVYQLRRADGTANPTYRGSLVARDGSVTELGPADYRIEATGAWTSKASGGRYPMGFRIDFPGIPGSLEVTPAFADQEMRMGRTTGVVYWEGAVVAGGTWRDAPAAGRGYTELVGYAPRPR
jgi:predicted secreted hydrolase